MAQTHRYTDRQTHGHGDSMTNSAWRGRVGENGLQQKYKHKVKRNCYTERGVVIFQLPENFQDQDNIS